MATAINISAKCLAVALIAATHAAALKAEGVPKIYRFGGMVSLAKPTAQLALKSDDGPYGKKGYGVSVFCEIASQGRFEFRTRFNYATFDGNDSIYRTNPNYSGYDYLRYSTNSNSMGLFLDLVGRITPGVEGAYFFAGTGLLNCKLVYNLKKYNKQMEIISREGSNSESGRAIGLSAGVGYNFTRDFGVEFKYTSGDRGVLVPSLPDHYQQFLQFEWLELSFVFRF
jgi:hypothetical protein